MKTFIPKAADIDRKWYVVDADGMVLGRLASQVANILRGKNKPIYTPNMDTGDYVIIINASKAILTGKKLDQKIYYHHSGYAGGLNCGARLEPRGLSPFRPGAGAWSIRRTDLRVGVCGE